MEENMKEVKVPREQTDIDRSDRSSGFDNFDVPNAS